MLESKDKRLSLFPGGAGQRWPQSMDFSLSNIKMREAIEVLQSIKKTTFDSWSCRSDVDLKTWTSFPRIKMIA